MPRTELIKNWVEIIAIIVAGLWAGYVFVYKEYFSATRFLDPTVQMKKYQVLTNGLIPVGIKITLENKSSRRLFIESAYFDVHGDSISPSDNYEMSQDNYERSLNNNSQSSVGYNIEQSALISGGQVFGGDWLDPNEKISRNRMVYIHSGQFSQLEANIYVLSTLNKDAIDVRQLVDSSLNVTWSVKIVGDHTNWHTSNSDEGMRLLNLYSGFSTANAYLPLIYGAPNQAN